MLTDTKASTDFLSASNPAYLTLTVTVKTIDLYTLRFKTFEKCSRFYCITQKFQTITMNFIFKNHPCRQCSAEAGEADGVGIKHACRNAYSFSIFSSLEYGGDCSTRTMPISLFFYGAHQRRHGFLIVHFYMADPEQFQIAHDSGTSDIRPHARNLRLSGQAFQFSGISGIYKKPPKIPRMIIVF